MYKNKIYMKILIIAGIPAIIFLSAVILFMERQNYVEKMEIIYYLTDGKENLEEVIALLKGTELSDVKHTKALLEEHGFSEEYQNVFFRGMRHRQMLILVCLLCSYLLFIGLILYSNHTSRRRRRQELNDLDAEFIKLREGKQILFKGNELALDDAMSRLQMNLESLSIYLRLMREESFLEKEETKKLVTDISHQLKTPVAALKMSFEILNSQHLSEMEQKEFKERCSIQLKHLEELLNSLISISRMEIGMIAINPKNACIYDTIVLSVERVYPGAFKKDIEISLDAEGDLQEVKVPHDPKWLSEALVIVLENSVKYSEQGKNIMIHIQKMSNFFRIEIEDEGIGISREERNEIFRRFYRGNHEVVKDSSGSGVGLYLAREILNRHSGTIAARSREMGKQGSRFVIQLPLKV